MKKMYLEGGRVCAAHGVRGSIKVESWCDTPRVLASRRRVFLLTKEGYREVRVLGASVAGQLVLMTLEGISDRDTALAMKNTVIYLHRDDIPVPEGQLLIQDIIGLSVIDAYSGRVYGTVSDVTEVPRGLLYTIATDSGDVYYPSGEQFIKEINADVGMIITPIPGFFE